MEISFSAENSKINFDGGFNFDIPKESKMTTDELIMKFINVTSTLLDGFISSNT